MRAKHAPKLWLLLLMIYELRLGTCNCSAHVLDDFNDNLKTAWQDFSFPVGPYANIAEQNGQFKFKLQRADQRIFVTNTKRIETSTLQEERTVEFRVELITG